MLNLDVYTVKNKNDKKKSDKRVKLIWKEKQIRRKWQESETYKKKSDKNIEKVTWAKR